MQLQATCHNQLLPKCRWLTSTQYVPHCQEGRQPWPLNFAVAGDTAVAAAVLPDLAACRQLWEVHVDKDYTTQHLEARGTARPSQPDPQPQAVFAAQEWQHLAACREDDAAARLASDAAFRRRVATACGMALGCGTAAAARAGLWLPLRAQVLAGLGRVHRCTLHAQFQLRCKTSLGHMALLLVSCPQHCFRLQCRRPHSCHTGERGPSSPAESPK